VDTLVSKVIYEISAARLFLISHNIIWETLMRGGGVISTVDFHQISYHAGDQLLKKESLFLRYLIQIINWLIPNENSFILGRD